MSGKIRGAMSSKIRGHVVKVSGLCRQSFGVGGKLFFREILKKRSTDGAWRGAKWRGCWSFQQF